MNDSVEPIGERLRTERERKKLTTQKAADQLHLDAWVIEALESGDYARIGPAVYAKGHLKRYAALLGLPPTQIGEDLESRPTTDIPFTQTAVLRMRASDPSARPRWIIPTLCVAVALGLIAALIWWRPWHPRGAAQQGAAHAVAPTAAAVVTPASVTAPLQPIPVAAPTPVAPPTPSAATPPVAPAATSDSNGTPPGSGHARLRLSFSADSWVDVHDASGAPLYAGNGRANSVRTLSGNAPFEVYLRAASGVQLEINHRAVAIGAQYLVGNVARFEAGADGVLRAPLRGAAPRPHD